MLTLHRSRGMPFFFFNDTATTEIYTLSLHDALPIYASRSAFRVAAESSTINIRAAVICFYRSEEHTSELQSHLNLVCRLLLEKKKTIRPKRKPRIKRSYLASTATLSNYHIIYN